MKKIILSIFLVSTLFTACRKNNGPAAEFDLGVDLQSNYKEDHVQVFIDDQSLFNSMASTNNILSLAGSIATTNTEGRHSIKVIINDSTTVTEEFEQQSDLYIGVVFNKDLQKVSFRYSPTKFVYD
jgi:hypothetical protein